MPNREHVLRTQMSLPLPVREVFDFFAAADNLQAITPPELGFRIVTPAPVRIGQGAIIDYRLGLFGLPFGWRSEITEWRPPHEFVDVQLRGPYAQWIHRHTFVQEGADTIIADEVRYRLPVPVLGELALPLVKLQLRRIFNYRQRRIRELLLAKP
jgi:ligand-binding SRPBCC domain-containing protein